MVNCCVKWKKTFSMTKFYHYILQVQEESFYKLRPDLPQSDTPRQKDLQFDFFHLHSTV